MDPFSIITGMKTTIDLVKNIKDVVDDAELKIQTSKLYDSVIALQNGVLAMQSENHTLLQSKHDLEKKLLEIENWNKEKARYKLIEISKGVLVYAYDTTIDPSIPAHYICKNCYEDKRKSILDPMFMHSDGSRYICQKCKAEFSTNVQVHYSPSDDDSDNDFY